MLFERERESNDFIAERQRINNFWVANSEICLSHILTVESSCGIEPQSLVNENLTIRLWRFTRTEVVCDKVSKNSKEKLVYSKVMVILIDKWVL